MGERGPAPSRSEERRRQNKPEGAFTKVDEAGAAKAGIEMRPTMPEPGEKWSERVVALYRSLATSPGVMFMYAADWELAWQACDQYDRNLKPQFVGFEDAWNSDANQMEHTATWATMPVKAATWTALGNTLRSFGVSEDARRRMQIEAPPVDVDDNGPVEDPDAGVTTDYAKVRTLRLASGTGSDH